LIHHRSTIVRVGRQITLGRLWIAPEIPRIAPEKMRIVPKRRLIAPKTARLRHFSVGSMVKAARACVQGLFSS